MEVVIGSKSVDFIKKDKKDALGPKHKAFHDALSAGYSKKEYHPRKEKRRGWLQGMMMSLSL